MLMDESGFPIRILHIVTVMDRGGIETMLMNYYRAIDKSRVQFDFLTHRSKKGAYDDEIRAMGGRIYGVSKLKPFSAAYQRELDRFFAQHGEYRVVHAHINSLSAFALHAAKKRGTPVRIAHAHTANTEKSMKGLVKRLCKPLLCQTATDLIACGERAGKWMYGRREFMLLRNAIDLRRFDYNAEARNKTRERLGVGNAPVIGHVGRFSREKNHSFLIKAFAELQKIEPSARLLLIGGGELEDDIRAMADEKCLKDSVNFLGVRDDLDKLYQAMDAFVLPSRFEGFCMALLEAQAAGLRCIASSATPQDVDITELTQHIPLKWGAKEWARQIANAVKGADTRRGRAEEIANAGFDIQKNAQALCRYYIEALRRSDAGGGG